MAGSNWVNEGIEDKVGCIESFKKDPANIKTLLRKLRIKSRDQITLTPVVVQRNNPDNHFELFNLYENKSRGRKALERYAFYSVCDHPVEEVEEIVNLAQTYDDCSSEEEQLLWLRVASPVVDSARLLSSFRVSNRISNEYLNRHRRMIIARAQERGVTFHKYSLYCDNVQARPKNSAGTSHPAIQLAVIAALGTL
ncbi:hypothetical protein KY310_03460 [Candidatus Woesearchaeota archaeon]|nr:hypothetical protein [Candidatus Woesearchaeota archaeon]